MLKSPMIIQVLFSRLILSAVELTYSINLSYLRDLDTPVAVESQVPAVFHFVSLELIYFLQFKKNIMKATMKGENNYD